MDGVDRAENSLPKHQNPSTPQARRLPWAWDPRGIVATAYVLVIGGKWWSLSGEELGGMTEVKRRDFGHIGLIMETELGEELFGEELFGEERCTHCQSLNQECWVYSAKGKQQVLRPGDSCARCRVTARKGDWSISTREKRDPKPPPPPLPRDVRSVSTAITSSLR